MKNIKFSKTVCGVDFLLNTGNYKDVMQPEYVDVPFTTDFFEVLFVEKANGSLWINDREYPLKDSVVLFLSKHQIRRWKIDCNTAEMRFLIFQDDFLNEFFSDHLFSFRLHYFYQDKYPLFLSLSENLFQQSQQKLDEIEAEIKKPVDDSIHIIRSLLYYMLMRLNREYAAQHQIDSCSNENQYAFTFRKLLETHIHHWQRTEDYAGEMNISRISLNKAVKKQYNTTASDLIKNKLIDVVKNELIFSSKTIKEIASQLSFSESQHMTRFFKEKTGITPTRFREVYQNGSQ